MRLSEEGSEGGREGGRERGNEGTAGICCTPHLHTQMRSPKNM